MNSKTTIITNEKCWMEHTALTQLETVSNLPGVVRTVDTRIERGNPVRVYEGMGFVRTV